MYVERLLDLVGGAMLGQILAKLLVFSLYTEER